MIFKLLNVLLLRFQAASEAERAAHLEQGWRVAEEVARRLAAQAPTRIALLESAETRATAMLRRHGFSVAGYTLAAEHRCLPRDRHPNPTGHREMLGVVLPHVLEGLRNRSRPLVGLESN